MRRFRCAWITAALLTGAAGVGYAEQPMSLGRLSALDHPSDSPESMSAAVNEDDRYWQSGFNCPGFDGSVTAVAEYNGDLIVAGTFLYAGTNRVNRIARWDGEAWFPMAGGMNNYVFALAIYDGKLIAGGNFSKAGDADAARIAQWDGTSWRAIGSGIEGSVDCLAIYEGDLVVGGEFTRAGGIPTNSLARWDGSEWHSLGLVTEYDNSEPCVTNVLPMDDRLVVVYEPTPSEDELIIWSAYAIVWEDGAWVPYEDHGSYDQMWPRCVASLEGDLVAGGVYADGYEERNAVARWTGDRWEEMGGEFTYATTALTIHDGRLYVASGEGVAWWDGARWIFLPGGPGGTVYELESQAGRLIAGGDFWITSNAAIHGLAAYDGNAWREIGDLRGQGCDRLVRALAAGSDHLYAMGHFEHAGAIRARYRAAWDGVAWAGLPGAGYGPDLDTRLLAVFDGDLISNGPTIHAKDGGWYRHCLDRWNGSAWDRIGIADDGVLALLGDRDLLIAGGQFTQIDETDAGRVAAYDGASWNPLGDGFFSTVSALASYGSDFVAAGYLHGPDSAGVVQPAVARWDGRAWRELGNGPGFQVLELVEHAQGLVASGRTRKQGSSSWQERLARWNGRAWLPFGGAPDKEINDLIVYNGSLIAAGAFTRIDESPLLHIARWNGESWEPLGSGTSGVIEDLVVWDGDLFAGGNFHAAGDKASLNIACWSEPEPAARPSSFSVTRADSLITFTWTNPSHPDYCETLIRFSSTDYPTGPAAGSPLENGNEGRFPGTPGETNSFMQGTDLIDGDLYYAAYAVTCDGRCSAPMYASIQAPDRTPPVLRLGLQHPSEPWETLIVSFDGSEPLDPETVRLLVGTTPVPVVCIDAEKEEWGGQHVLAAPSDSLMVLACAGDPAGNEGCATAVLSVASIRAADGGCLSSTDDRLTLSLPPGSLPADCHLTVMGCPDPADEPGCYRIGPDGLPVEGASLSIAYTAEDLQGRDPDQLFILRDGQEAMECYVDVDAGIVSTKIDRLSRFSLSLGTPRTSIIVDRAFLTLEPASPNPSFTVTRLRYELRDRQHTRVTIHDATGRQVAELLDAEEEPGIRTIAWDGMTAGGYSAPSGVYFCRVATDHRQLTKRVVRVR
jgi:hypothetical protein